MAARQNSIVRVTLGLAALFAALIGLSQLTDSNYGEGGPFVLGGVLLVLLGVEAALWNRRPKSVLIDSGFKVPSREGMLAGAVVSAILALGLVGIVFAAPGDELVRPNWLLTIVGLFAQGGLAEELVFRGYLFRRLREGHDFWQAALVSMVPFVLVHLYLFATMSFAVAAMALLVAVLTSFPFAKLFEIGKGSIWPCALLHFTTHLIKLVIFADENSSQLAVLSWMALVLAVPWLVFAFGDHQFPSRRTTANSLDSVYDGDIPAGKRGESRFQGT